MCCTQAKLADLSTHILCVLLCIVLGFLCTSVCGQVMQLLTSLFATSISPAKRSHSAGSTAHQGPCTASMHGSGSSTDAAKQRCRTCHDQCSLTAATGMTRYTYRPRLWHSALRCVVLCCMPARQFCINRVARLHKQGCQAALLGLLATRAQLSSSAKLQELMLSTVRSRPCSVRGEAS